VVRAADRLVTGVAALSARLRRGRDGLDEVSDFVVLEVRRDVGLADDTRAVVPVESPAAAAASARDAGGALLNWIATGEDRSATCRSGEGLREVGRLAIPDAARSRQRSGA
jgi:hypothetical protein